MCSVMVPVRLLMILVCYSSILALLRCQFVGWQQKYKLELMLSMPWFKLALVSEIQLAAIVWLMWVLALQFEYKDATWKHDKGWGSEFFLFYRIVFHTFYSIFLSSSFHVSYNVSNVAHMPIFCLSQCRGMLLIHYDVANQRNFVTGCWSNASNLYGKITFRNAINHIENSFVTHRWLIN